MNDFKGILASRSIWAGVIGFVAMLLDMFGMGGDIDQSGTVDAIIKVVEGASFIAAALFRVIATKRIS